MAHKKKTSPPSRPGPPPAVGAVESPALPSPAGVAVILAAAALTLLFLSLSITPLTNNDIWLHMANGEWILENGHVPLHDPYSFSAAGNRFYAHEWLAGILFDLFHRLGGVTGLILSKAILGGAALLICALAARLLGAGWIATITCSGIALGVVNSRFLERPELFSYVLTALYLWVLVREQGSLQGEPEGGRLGKLLRPRALLRASRLWWLVPFHWLWVQLHGYFLTGLALLGLYLLAEAARRLVVPRTSPRTVLTPRLVSGSLAVAAMLPVGLFNPNGLESYTFPFQLAGGNNIFMQTIFEWRPTFVTAAMTHSSMFIFFCLLLGLVVISCLDSVVLLARRAWWRVANLGCLAGLLMIRQSLASLPQPESRPASAWLWSPAELFASVTEEPRFLELLDPLFAVFRLAGSAGDDIFTFLWVALAVLVAARWRQPAAAGLPILAVTILFLLLPAGENAGVIVGLVVGPALAYAVLRRTLPLWQAAILGVFLVLAVRQNRNIVNFALVSMPVVAAGLTRVATALRRLPTAAENGATTDGRWLSPSVQTGLLAALFTIMFLHTWAWGWPYTPQMTKQVGLGVGPRIPVGAVEYIRAAGIRGNAFNKYPYGAYLIHELYPSTRVYMDSRNDVYGPHLYQTYLQTLGRSDVAARVFASNPFDYVLVDYRFYPARSPDAGLFTYLFDSGKWVLVYFDDTSVLYLADRPEHAAIIARDGYRIVDPVKYRPGLGSQMDAASRALYDAETERAVRRKPGSVVARLMRAESLSNQGDKAAALEMAESVLEDDPKNFVTLVVAARLSRQLGHREAALGHYRRALQLSPAMEQVRHEMEQMETTSP